MDLAAAYAQNRPPQPRLLYSARAAYGLSSLFPADWAALAERIAADNATFDLYNAFFHTGNKAAAAQCGAKCRESELCGLVSATSGLFKNCTKQPQLSHC